METIRVDLPRDLVQAAGFNAADPSHDAAMLLALELYREGKISAGRAAELCQVAIEQFLVFSGNHDAPLHYDLSDLEADRLTLDRLGL